MQNPKNVAALQILRALAAILVVIWHSHLAIKYTDANYWVEGDAQYRMAHYPAVLNHMDIGVDIFFCISGFIMAMLIYKLPSSAESSFTFLVKRALRIVPPYWFFSALVVIAFIVSAGKFNVANLSGHFLPDASLFVRSLLLVPMPDGPVLGVGWTLIHETLFYYLCAIAVVLHLNRRLAELLFVLSVIAVGLSLFKIQCLYGFVLSPYCIDFFFGALAFRVSGIMSKSGWRLQLLVAALGYVGVSMLLDSGLPDALYVLVRPLASGLVSFFLITGLIGADGERSITTTLPGAVMMRIGDASYTLYLVHWFVLSIMGKLISVVPHLPIPAVIVWHVLSILSAIVVAVVLAEKIELPFHRYLLARFGQRGSRSTPRATVNTGP